MFFSIIPFSKKQAMNEILNNGLQLMMIGMVIVFAFLSLLVIMINIMAWAIQCFFPEEPIALTPPSASTHHTNTNIDANIIVTISTAIHQYRHKHK